MSWQIGLLLMSSHFILWTVGYVQGERAGRLWKYLRQPCGSTQRRGTESVP